MRCRIVTVHLQSIHLNRQRRQTASPWIFSSTKPELFAKHNVPTSAGRVTDSAAGAKAIAEEIGKPVMVKAQVKVGGRGKAGGVKSTPPPPKTRTPTPRTILGLDIKGHIVKKLLVAEASDIAEEYYVSFLLDRANRTYLAVCRSRAAWTSKGRRHQAGSACQGARQRGWGVDLAFARSIAEQGHLPAEVLDAAAVTIAKLWEVFVKEDATLVEVNPLVRTPDDQILALDGKVTLDANADFRQPGHVEFEDKAATDPLELKAREHDLNYVKLDGEVGVIGNGAAW